MSGSRKKSLKRTFDIWCKINNCPKEEQKSLFRHFKKAYQEDAKIGGRDESARRVSKRRKSYSIKSTGTFKDIE